MTGRIILINLIVLVGLLALIEGIFRFTPLFPEPEFPPKGLQANEYASYTMTNVPKTPSRDSKAWWRDRTHNGWIEAVQGLNNHGYRMDEDVTAWQSPAKKPGEKIVVLTGGSAVQGVGASSNDTTIDAYMERELNARQDRYHYRVLNFAMGSWNSFQQLIGLMLYAKPYDPDWVVVMDGYNDIAICCGHMQGAGETLYSGLVRSYINGYLARNPNPDFYRGAFENWLVTHSVAYRKITGKTPIERVQKLIPSDEGYQVGAEVNWEDVKRQLYFYLRTQAMLVSQFPRARVILSLQPVYDNPDTIFSKNREDYQAIDSQMEGKVLSDRLWTDFDKVFGYFYFNADSRFREYARQQQGRVEYFNMNYVLPVDEDVRRRDYFIDRMHLLDKGGRQVGRFYALKILGDDFPQKRPEFEAELARDYPPFPAPEPASGPRP